MYFKRTQMNEKDLKEKYEKLLTDHQKLQLRMKLADEIVKIHTGIKLEQLIKSIQPKQIMEIH